VSPELNNITFPAERPEKKSLRRNMGAKN